MTVPNATVSVSYNGDAVTTAFSVPFKFAANADLAVTLDSNPWVLGVDYTLSGAGVDAGGTLTATVAPGTGAVLVITRETAPTQGVHLLSQGPYTPGTLEGMVDRVSMVACEQAEDIAALQTNQATDETNIAALQSTLNSISGNTYVPNVSRFAQQMVPGGRLTLTSGTPITAQDVTSATTVYYSPLRHALVPLYDGSNWGLYSFAELSQATTDNTKSHAAVANNKNYDMLVWNDNGTVRCTRSAPWSTNTSRGTGAGTPELVLQDGRWVNAQAVTNGPAAKRGLYVGTIRSDGSATINDSAALRHTWNMHNRIRRGMTVTDAAGSWSYSTSSFRQANANAANQLSMVRGLDEDVVDADVKAMVQNTAGGVNSNVGIGLDSTTINSATRNVQNQNSTANYEQTQIAEYQGCPGLGYRNLVWLELAGGANTSWLGSAGNIKSGIGGSVMA